MGEASQRQRQNDAGLGLGRTAEPQKKKTWGCLKHARLSQSTFISLPVIIMILCVYMYVMSIGLHVCISGPGIYSRLPAGL